jgi:hypothetical protein
MVSKYAIFSNLFFSVTTHIAATRESPIAAARALDPNCSPDPVCDPLAKFRTFDGTCNNLKTPKWGSAGTPLQRVLPNAYAEGGK